MKTWNELLLDWGLPHTPDLNSRMIDLLNSHSELVILHSQDKIVFSLKLNLYNFISCNIQVIYVSKF